MPEVGLNEIFISPRVPDATLALRTDLYDIESTNTTEARIQSVSTDNGSEHTVQKVSNESLIATKIPEGTCELFVINTEARQATPIAPMIILTLKG